MLFTTSCRNTRIACSPADWVSVHKSFRLVGARSVLQRGGLLIAIVHQVGVHLLFDWVKGHQVGVHLLFDWVRVHQVGVHLLFDWVRVHQVGVHLLLDWVKGRQVGVH